MSGSLSVALPGRVWDLAAPDADGPILTTGYDGKNLSTTVLTALDLNGQTLWRRTFEGLPGLPRYPRISGDGTAWFAHEGARGTGPPIPGPLARLWPLPHRRREPRQPAQTPSCA